MNWKQITKYENMFSKTWQINTFRACVSEVLSNPLRPLLRVTFQIWTTSVKYFSASRIDLDENDELIKNDQFWIHQMIWGTA